MLKLKYSLVIVCVIQLVGCKSTREFYTKDGSLKNISDAKLITSVEDQYIEYNSLFFKKFKAELSYNDDAKSFKGNMFILKDTSMVVSINPLMGIELFRVKLSPDAVEIIDRTKKTYSHGDYEILWKKFMIELDYYTLQQIVTNRMFVYPIDDAEKSLKRYKHYCSENMYQFQSVKEGKFSRKYRKEKTENIIFHQMSVLPDVFKVKSAYIRDFSVNSEVTITYDLFTNENGHLMPSLINISGTRGTDRFSLRIQFDNFELDGDNSIGFKVSEKYKQLDFKNGN
ncbi:DUF4292 domain-containing protein [Carboxylicivirga mesophila]|uniref:DUF4292 domain-containing protein n=1 Tax=Carboxylicivirga mesophila TaxID=1166478 RepID=A0ABS5KDW1_9BACT|nr:DUF4292 domain-containing protein [Carboxylicivirga mesophila]